MNCDAFDSALLDLLYDELPADQAPELAAHTATCSACAKRLETLQKTRATAREALEVPLPAGLEARILRAAEKAAPPRTGVIAFLSRPQFALAAAFVLVLGSALVFSSSAKRDAAKSVAQAPADDEPRGAPTALAEAPPPPAPVASAAPPTGEAKPASPEAPGALALNSPPAARPHAAPKAAKPSSLDGPDDAFTSARALFLEGRYAEALPKFEALAPHDPQAELFAARCVAKLRGCEAAQPRFDGIAQRHPNTDVARRATAEASRCPPRASATSASPSR